MEQSWERIAPSPSPRCSSYWKGSHLVTLNYGRQLTFSLISTAFISRIHWDDTSYLVSFESTCYYIDPARDYLPKTRLVFFFNVSMTDIDLRILFSKIWPEWENIWKRVGQSWCNSATNQREPYSTCMLFSL